MIIFIFLGREFQDLMREARRSRGHAFAVGTFSNLRTQFRSYFAFCVYFGRVSLPADVHTICGYVQFLSRTLKPPSVRNYLSGVKMLHVLVGFEYRFSDDISLGLVVRGINRMNPHVPRRARPVTPADLSVFLHNMDGRSSLHCATFACCLVAFFTMSRLGSILPESTKTSSGLFLQRDCINFSEEGLLVTFLHTKTIQFGRRRLHVPLPSLSSGLCPVRAYRAFLRSLGSLSSPHAFCFLEGTGSVRVLTKSVFINTFREVMRSGGDGDVQGFTGHSFRRGGASCAFRAGIPGEIIQICGDWASDAYKRYLEFSIDNKLFIAKKFAAYLCE